MVEVSGCSGFTAHCTDPTERTQQIQTTVCICAQWNTLNNVLERIFSIQAYIQLLITTVEPL